MLRLPLFLLLLTLTPACGTAVLGTPALEGPGGGEALTWEDPFEGYPFTAAVFLAEVHPVLVRDGCANAGCHAAEEKTGRGLWIHAGLAQTGVSLQEDLASVIQSVSFDVPASQTRLIYHPVASTRSHAGRTPWWGILASESAPYAAVAEWIEQATVTADCYEAAFALSAQKRPEGVASCTPAPAESCWPDC